ncbi:DUF4150 domain-containing protein [Vibrio lamellibrachiae]|uniref:DUF4150 domain-containing protein n=1 Tax=Vibrio lamellibrachiae TaxID=2910253 RepID=UPI003D0BB316
MSVTVCANGLSVVHQGSGGEANATLPDVCKTSVGKSTVDISYQNSAKSSDLAGGTTTVTADGGNSIAIHGSTFSTSTGDEGGDKKGVSSGTIQGEAEFISSSPTVKIEGLGVCRLSDQMTMNEANTMCLGGVQNPSVVVTEDQVGTFTVYISCHYPDGELLKNSNFDVLDEDEGIISSGRINDTGVGEVPGLQSGALFIKVYESDDDYVIQTQRQANVHCRVIDEPSFFELASKEKQPFWLPKKMSHDAPVWGVMSPSLSSSNDFEELVLLETQSYLEYRHPSFSISELSSALINCLEEPDSIELQAFMYEALPHALDEGELLASLLFLSEGHTADDYFAFMRLQGKGNPIKYLSCYGWDVMKHQVNTWISGWLEKIKERLSSMQSYAGQLNYDYLSGEVYPAHIDTIQQWTRKLPEYTDEIITLLKDKSSLFINERSNVMVVKPVNATTSAEVYEVKLPVNTKKTLDVEEPLAFHLGWMQNEVTRPLDSLWAELFTDDTSAKQQALVKETNSHLNDPVRQGEIVILPTVKPRSAKEEKDLIELQEEALAASIELGKLTDDEVATANNFFELFDHLANNAIDVYKENGLPNDYYSYASIGVGAAASGTIHHLTNINNILKEINDLYVSHVSKRQTVGYVNHNAFFQKRTLLLKKLDGSFSALSKKSIKIPAYKQVKRNLKLSTKSVIHNADQIIAKGFVPNLGKRMANVALGITTSRQVGYVGITLGAASGMKNIYEACNIDGSGNCGKTTTREIAGFGFGIFGGSKGAVAGVALAVGVVGAAASAPVIAIATITGVVVGGAIGGTVGATGGKVFGDIVHEYLLEPISEVFE